MKTRQQKQRAALDRRQGDYHKWLGMAHGEEPGSTRRENFEKKAYRAAYDVKRLELQLGVS